MNPTAVSGDSKPGAAPFPGQHASPIPHLTAGARAGAALGLGEVILVPVTSSAREYLLQALHCGEVEDEPHTAGGTPAQPRASVSPSGASPSWSNRTFPDGVMHQLFPS